MPSFWEMYVFVWPQQPLADVVVELIALMTYLVDDYLPRLVLRAGTNRQSVGGKFSAAASVTMRSSLRKPGLDFDLNGLWK